MDCCSICAAAKRGPLPEWELRKRQKEGRLPGFFSGTRFYVRYDILLEMIERESRRNAGIKD